MKTKVDIISGFLGAGKTTLIKKLLEEKLYNEKLVLIENEFGEIGIDGTILSKSGIEIKEINSGCICCTLVGDFEKAIREVVDKYKPDRIIIEPSGVGKLSDVIKACETSKLKDILAVNMLVAVVDVMKFQIYISNFGEFYENQIKSAKTIIISRTQKADVAKIQSVVASIRKLNEDANIVTTPWDSIEADKIIAVAERDLALSLENQLKASKKVILKRNGVAKKCGCGHEHIHNDKNHDVCGCEDNNHMHNHRADEVFDVWGIETPGLFSFNQLERILLNLSREATFGMVLRGKGFLQAKENKWVQFDYVHGEYDIKDTDADYTGRICIIGRGLNKEELKKAFMV